MIVAYAHLEWQLSRMTYSALDVDPVAGRIAVAEPRATDRFPRLRELMLFKGLTTSIDLDLIAESINTCEAQRNRLAHGTWFKDPDDGKLLLGVYRGSWRPDPKEGKTSRAIVPEANPYSLEECRTLTSLIVRTIEALTDLDTEMTARYAPLRERLEPAQAQNQRPDQAP